ncbi:MAG: superoxide dismutase [Cu-Zn] SodC [Kiloniellales bacterium]
MHKLLTAGVAGFLAGIASLAAQADEVTIEIHKISKDGVGPSIGSVKAMDSDNGLVLQLDLAAELTPGPHGFHVHQNGSCDAAEQDGVMVAGLAAGGHFDPHGSGKHLGPSGEGHLGDLPVLYVEADGNNPKPVKHSLVAPRLTVGDIRGLSLMIHDGGDNFRDEPKPLGGGGARIACGVIPE